MAPNKNDVTVLQNRSFSSALTSAALCQGMDLIALVLDGKTVVVHRFTWQRLAMFVPTDGSDARIECVTWSPDGAILAVALNSGRVSLYGVDAVLRRTKDVSAALANVTLPAAPSALSWSSAVDGSDIDKSMYRERVALGVQASPPTDNRRFTLLAIGDDTGHVSLYGRDLAYSMGRVRVLPTPVSRVQVVENVVVAIGVSEDGVLHASAIPRPKSAEVWRVGSEVVALQTIRSEFKAHMKRVRERWTQCVEQSLGRSIEKPLEEALQNFSVGAWDVLCDVHHSASLHPAAAHCLSDEIGEGGAREALRTFRGGADDVEDALLNVVQAAETLLFRASEYRALADVEPVLLGKVGVVADDCAELVDAATELYAVATGAVTKLYAICVETDAFLTWLISVAQTVGRDEDDGPIPNAVPHTGAARQLVARFFARHSADVDAGCQDEFARIVNAQLAQCEAAISKAIDKLVDAPHAALSKNIANSSKCAIRVGKGIDATQAAVQEIGDGSIEICVPGKDGCISILRFVDGLWRAVWGQLELNGQSLRASAHCPGNQYFVAVQGDEALRLCVCDRKRIDEATWAELGANEVMEMESEPVALEDNSVVHELAVSSAVKDVSLDVYADKACVVLHPQRAVLLSLGKE